MAIVLRRAHQPHTWRVRLAILLDLCGGAAMIPALFYGGFAISGLINMPLLAPLLEFAPVAMLAAAVLAFLLWLSWRGQTPDLAAVRLRWADTAGQASTRRLRGELQYWCLALPVCWVLCDALLGEAVYVGPLGPLAAALNIVAIGFSPLLVIGGLALMAVSRRNSGQLVPVADTIIAQLAPPTR